MPDEDDAGGGGRDVPCAVCGRAIQVSGTGLPGSPGHQAGSVIDNQPVCKSCQAGRYRAGRGRATGKRAR